MRILLSLGVLLALLGSYVPTTNALTVDALTGAEDDLVHTFMRTGARTSPGYDGSSLADTEFDFRAFLNHECYRPIGEIEWEHCRQMFGAYADLEDVLQSGMLFNILYRNFLLDEPELVPIIRRTAPVYDEEHDATMDSDARRLYYDEERGVYTYPLGTRRASDDISNNRWIMRDRADELWNICERRYGRDNRDACYQENIRLIQDFTIPLEENVFFTAD